MPRGDPMRFEPIGVIHTPWTAPAGAPIQPSAARSARGWVDLDPRYAGGLKDLEGFERVWLVYVFHRCGPVRLSVRPFLDEAERGVFATRAPCWPNPIGISSVRLLGIEGARLEVCEADMLDGTPLLDIKPYVPQFDHYPVERVGWLAGKSPRGQAADDRFGEGREGDVS